MSTRACRRIAINTTLPVKGDGGVEVTGALPVQARAAGAKTVVPANPHSAHYREQCAPHKWTEDLRCSEAWVSKGD